MHGINGFSNPLKNRIEVLCVWFCGRIAPRKSQNGDNLRRRPEKQDSGIRLPSADVRAWPERCRNAKRTGSRMKAEVKGGARLIS